MEKGPAHCTPFETLVRRDLRSTTEETKTRADGGQRRTRAELAEQNQFETNADRGAHSVGLVPAAEPRERQSFSEKTRKKGDTVKMVVDIVEKLLL